MFDDKKFVEKLATVERRYEELNAQLADPGVIGNKAEFLKLSREHAGIYELIEAVQKRRDVSGQLAEARAMLADPDMRDLAKDEVTRLEAELNAIDQGVKLLLLPKDPADAKNVILEIRAGTGGDEAALFAADLFRMYSRYAERKNWKLEILSTSTGGAGGFREVIALIEGKNAFSHLKFESGVHRVQRVPATETAGRIHTSTATVAVLPEAEEVEVHLDPKDIRIDVMRASGPGGQSVNTTDSAVRITHIASGMMVVCMDEKSQTKNKAKAMKILTSRILDIERQKQDDAERDARRSQVKGAERSDKSRTYNFPQDRLTDHRIGLTKHDLDSILDGQLDDVIEALRTNEQASLLEQATR